MLILLVAELLTPSTMSHAVAVLEKLIGDGKYLEARTKASALKADPDNHRVIQLLALSMAKSAAPKAAMDLLEPIYREHPDDPETAGILGSIYKELFKETRNSKYAILSRDTYLNNFRLTRNHYTGINAASMYAISGSTSRAKEIARELVAQLSPSSTDLWELASLAEAFILIREHEKGVEMYARCRRLIGADWGKVSSVFNQLWLLNHYISIPNEVMNMFSPPAVTAFVGHMIDHPIRRLDRFPPEIEGEVRTAIAGAIRSIDAKIGYCSLACGSDILFAEAMAESGGELNLFLPFHEDDFVETSIAFAGAHWLERFNALKSKFPVQYITRERYMGNDDLFAFQSQIIFGCTVQRAAMLHTLPHLITVYADVDIQKHLGGTYDTLKFWPHDKVININPQRYINSTLPRKAAAGDLDVRPMSLVPPKNRHVRYLLGVTVESSDTALFQEIRHQLNAIDEETTAHLEAGNFMLMAFAIIEDTISMAWDLLKTPGFFGRVKICLHAGPVYMENRVGLFNGPAADIMRAISDVSVPGNVYSSFQFASLLALQANQFAVEYAGIVAIDGEATSIYRVNRNADVFDII